MKKVQRIGQFGVLLGLLTLISGCIIAGPREGYYDRDHARYYHNHAWYGCGDHDDHCR